MPEYITQTMIALKLVWFRVLCYFLVPFVVTFISETETWSGETWDHTHWFLKARLFLVCSLMGINNLIAFIDQTLTKAKDEIKNTPPPLPNT